MASFVPTPAMSDPQDHRTTRGTVIFSYTCVGLTGTALVAVLIFYCYHQFRRRAPVTAAEAEGNPGPEDHHVGVDVTKLPEYAYTQSSRRRTNGDGAQCSVCLGAVLPGEMVRRLPMCKHLYHVDCIDITVSAAEHQSPPPWQKAIIMQRNAVPEFAYTQSARRDGGDEGAQCSVCLGTVQAGEMARRLPSCKHLYHVECIDMWLASHTTCPLCRADVEPPGDDDRAALAEEQELPV
ncbi:hypothetical protein BAE44_0000530 [Dichanthelium oligosanthes]|uniref:RING-type E3 ubiquitin transferase n=1 Tax=Dichanthelium oligosanthes TaxID=888268 RepID=A0A1E5WM09_9POAL|nr:hypothetical protein BAE44_0000530 [Dichanthelium oligosanthes]